MKREMCAVLLLAALVGVSLWNIRKADALIKDIEEHLDLSEKAMLAGDPGYAEEQLSAALRIWLSAGEYTQIFLRHPELDATSDVFYEALQCLREGKPRTAQAVFARLRYHLDSISGMEHISLGSVL